MRVLPHTKSCFVCGEANPAGLQLKFETDGQQVRTHFVLQAEHIGFKKVIHGGIVATVLDEIMAWACAVGANRFGYCAELNVRFASPARPGQTVFATGELVANRRNKVFETRSELRDANGVLLATATGKYLPIKGPELQEMLADMTGNLEYLTELKVKDEVEK